MLRSFSIKKKKKNSFYIWVLSTILLLQIAQYKVPNDNDQENIPTSDSSDKSFFF